MKLSKVQLAAVAAAYVVANKISIDTFAATKNNSVGLLDQIAKTITMESNYSDKLSMFDGDVLEFGKTIQEWKSDLILPEDYDEDGQGALAPHKSTYRPVSFSYTQGRKKIPQTIYNNDIERAVKNAGEFASIIADKYKVMTDSETLFRYQLKRQALGILIARCIDAMNASGSGVVTFAAGTKIDTVNTLVKESGKTVVYTLVKPYPANGADDFDDAVAKGYLIENKLVTEIAKPVDETTGEAFLTQLYKDVEVAADYSEGHSLNGNTLGSTAKDGLVLVMLQGIRPVIDTQVLAGAFHADKTDIPVMEVAIPDFGSDNSGAYAVLMDKRGMRCYNSYRAVRENLNGDGDFLNLFFHTENTVHISRNVFVKVYKPQA